MKLILLLLFLFALLSFQGDKTDPEQLVFNRIEYIFQVRSDLDENVWRGFNHKKYDLPLLYYTANGTYVANPTKKFLKIYSSRLVFKTDKIKIYKTKERIDDQIFHMETGMSYNTDEKKSFNYKSPYMFCSSYEIISATIPDIPSTEYWVTMIIHEYFHGFQFKHSKYTKEIMPIIGQISEDSLANICAEQLWFKEKVTRENQYLLQALAAEQEEETQLFLDSFLMVRQARRAETLEKLHFQITPSELIYETMEGTARFVEFQLQKRYEKLPIDQKLLRIDPFYRGHQDFKNYSIDNDPWMYTLGNRYFYATGFNIIRVLEKLGIKYKNRLFVEGKISLEQILLEGKNSDKGFN